MSDVFFLLLAFMAGLVLGALFFGGLWLTVKAAFASKTPALWFLSSYLFRVSIVLIGFYHIAMGNWQGLLVSMLGFVVARYIIVRLTKKQIHHEP